MNSTDDQCPTLEKHMLEKVEKVAEDFGVVNPDIDVKKALAKGENFLGDIYKVEAKGVTKDQERKKLKLILKAANLKPTCKDSKDFLAEFYMREIMAYTLVFPIFHGIENEYGLKEEERFYHPTFYACNEESFKRLIIMDDITENGFRMSNKFESMDYQHAVLVIKFLAKFHALSFVYRQKDPNGYDDVIDKITFEQDSKEFEGYSKVTFDLVMKLIEDDIECKEKMEAISNNVMEIMKEMMDYKSIAPYYTICHGDCWNNNFMFKYEDGKPVDVRFLDWQIIKASSPVQDLAHVMSVNSDEEFRRNHLENILDMYYENLEKCIKRFGLNIDDLYPRKIYEDHIKRFFRFGLIIAVYVLPFIMTDKEEILDVKDVTDTNKEGFLNNVSFSKKAEERIKGLIKDYVRLKYI